MKRVNSGIYAIKNTVSNKVYVGSTKNFKVRWEKHRAYLRGNYHPNKHLQSSWNKYGEESFEFIILEEVLNLDIILDREQFWMDRTKCYKDTKGYNIRVIAESNKGARLNFSGNVTSFKKGSTPWNKGLKYSEEYKKKLGEAHKGLPSGRKGKKASPETIKKLSESHLGKAPWNKGMKFPDRQGKYPFSEDSLKRSRESRRRLTDDQVRSVRIRVSEGGSMRTIAKEFGVSPSTIQSIKTGKFWSDIK